MGLKTRKELIAYCLTYRDVFEDYPFHEDEWATISHKGSRKVFAWISFE